MPTYTQEDLQDVSHKCDHWPVPLYIEREREAEREMVRERERIHSLYMTYVTYCCICNCMSRNVIAPNVNVKSSWFAIALREARLKEEIYISRN